ncbi:MAG: hypothetical protein HQL36_09205, partial [Alphaproteobacteria bacterium]|nr:hypothetical protein [Alphaproteobacteria bacterium]
MRLPFLKKKDSGDDLDDEDRDEDLDDDRDEGAKPKPSGGFLSKLNPLSWLKKKKKADEDDDEDDEFDFSGIDTAEMDVEAALAEERGEDPYAPEARRSPAEMDPLDDVDAMPSPSAMKPLDGDAPPARSPSDMAGLDEELFPSGPGEGGGETMDLSAIEDMADFAFQAAGGGGADDEEDEQAAQAAKKKKLI